jgi:uncharacterized membrane protein
MDKGHLHQHVQKRYGYLPIPLDVAKSLPPQGPWTGTLFGTMASDRDSVLYTSLFKTWLPRDAVIAIHGWRSRSEVLKWIPEVSGHYQMKQS